jgi:endonuclease YncB( thermonuclease family)
LPVDQVVDGDTLVLPRRERLRVLGIDTPEMRGDTEVERRLARDARAELQRLLGNGRVVLVGRPSHEGVHGRTLAYLHAARADGSPGEDLGARLIETGFAHAYPAEHPRLAPYLQLQEQARAAGRGVWGREGLAALAFGHDLQVDAAKAGEHVGHRARVVGKVFDTHRSEGALFVNLGPNWRTDFTAVILRRHWGLFPADAETEWKGRVVAVTGEIEKRDGRPQVLLRDPGQLELLER